MDNKPKWAVIGLGRIGTGLESDPLREKPCTHAGAIAADKRVLLAAGCDIDEDARAKFSRQWEHLAPAPELYDNPETMLKICRPDLLTIATPAESHLRLVRLAVRYRVPVIVCEKPLAWNLSQARAIRNIERRKQVRIVVNHERRFSADYIAVREAVISGRYGRLLSINGTLCFGRSASHRSVLIHDGSHMIDAVNYLTGERFRPLSRTGNPRSSLGSYYLTGTAGRVNVSIEAGGERDHLVFRLDLGFESGRIELGNGFLRFHKSADSPYYAGFRSLVPDTAPEIGKTGYFSGMVSEAVRLYEDPHSRSRSSAEDGWAVLSAIG
jgi:predicted dehydrogenase